MAELYPRHGFSSSGGDILRGLHMLFWTSCLQPNVIVFYYKQDSLMRDTAAFDDSIVRDETIDAHMLDCRNVDNTRRSSRDQCQSEIFVTRAEVICGIMVQT